MRQLYVARTIPQTKDGDFDFSQIEDGLKLNLHPYLKIININREHYPKFAQRVAQYLKEKEIAEIPVDILSRLPRNLEGAEQDLESVYNLNNHSKSQIVKKVSFSYGSVITPNEAYIRLNNTCKGHSHPRLGCESKLFQIIAKEEYLKFIEKAKEETIRLNEKAKKLGLKIGPENMPCIDYAEIAESSRKQSDFERGLRFGNAYFPNLNNPGFIGCNPFGDLKYLLEDDMFLTLDTEHFNFSLLASDIVSNIVDTVSKIDIDLNDKSPFLNKFLGNSIAELIKKIPQELGIVHLGAGFNLFYPHIVGEERILQIASHFPFIFPNDFHKLSEEAQKVYLESVSSYFMKPTEIERKNFMQQCVNALKQRKDDPLLVMEFEVGRINKENVWHNIYSGDLWEEFQQISKQNLESLL